MSLRSGYTSPSSADDDEWFQLDALIQGWILSTISDEVSDLVISTTSTAAKLWRVIHALFHDNKHARAMQLEHQFRTTVKGMMTMAMYCQTPRNIADWGGGFGRGSCSPGSGYGSGSGHSGGSGGRGQQGRNYVIKESLQLSFSFSKHFPPLMEFWEENSRFEEKTSRQGKLEVDSDIRSLTVREVLRSLCSPMNSKVISVASIQKMLRRESWQKDAGTAFNNSKYLGTEPNYANMLNLI
ncbi:unnamed protein product [Cuscuta campestris]|uniref:Uncharacterized protein n=1 Tax=Cuscuta campestris TaxID=132261 RepID=A0A484KDK5_9ASTE|nr:unnamed protein product [Cuscuta campestris]